MGRGAAALWLALALGCSEAEDMSDTISPPTHLPSLVGRDLGLSRTLRAAQALALPEELQEISGLTLAPDGRLAAVQDEEAALFLMDIEGILAGGAPGAIERMSFGLPGDHEGVAWADSTCFVLRSDGTLLELRQDGEHWTVGSEWKRRGPKHDEYEGLCFDRAGGRLLVAAKGRVRGKKGRSRERMVYGFDLETRRWLPEPVLVLDLKTVADPDGPAADDLPHRRTKKGKRKVDFAMELSGIAVHPGTGELYLLSGPDRTLFVVDDSGHLLRAWVFRKDELPQPEGLAFLGDGTLVLSSEAAGGDGVLVVVQPLD